MKNVKTLPSHLNFFNRDLLLGVMETKNNYTIPVLKKGKTWHVEYYFNGIRYRLSEGINRIKDLTKREKEAEDLLLNITKDLEDGFNPEKPDEYILKLFGENISLDKAISKFLEYHKKLGSRKKSIQSYASKLKYLNLFFKGISLKMITTNDLENYFFHKINVTETIVYVDDCGITKTIKTVKWSQKTVKGAKAVFIAFFNWSLKKKYIDINPFNSFDKLIKSKKETEEKHVPFSDEDAKAIMEQLDKTDKLGALFCRFIYGTCVRPSELRKIQLKHINIESKTMRIPFSCYEKY